jgi:hypothetical protein
MTGKLTKKHSINNAKEFVDSVLSTNTNYYMFASHHQPWPVSETIVPATNTSIDSTEHSIYNHILFGKNITTNDVKYMIPRYNWVSDTAYSRYDKDNPNLYNNNFFVITPEQNVYKVLDNNKNGKSVVKPNIVSNSVFKTSDNYIWKYMFTIDDTSMRKFATREYIPVVANTNIQQSANPGGIDIIKINSGGSLWLTYNTGFITNVVASNELIINSDNASSNSNFYTGASIYLKNGLGSGQISEIIGYNATTKSVTLHDDLDVAFNLELSNTSGSFLIGDNVSETTYFLNLSYITGTFDIGDTITQSATGATGEIIRSQLNKNNLTVRKLTGTFSMNNSINSGDTPILGTGTVTTTTSSNTITGVGTSFTTLFPSASDNTPYYIQVGSYFRRVTSVTNNISLKIDGTGFNDNYSANVFYKVPSAAYVSSFTKNEAIGTILFSDLNSVKLDVININKKFFLGEVVSQPGSSSNGTIVYVTNNYMIVSDIQGPGFSASNSTVTFTISGYTSQATANVSVVTSRPSITLNYTSGKFIVGDYITTTIGSSAKIKSVSSLPNDDTEYVIAPTITITGDGYNAKAYPIINTSNYSIDSVNVINPGTGYTQANVIVTSNSTYGSGANLVASIGPVRGHGYDPVTELGGNYVMIATDFGKASDEAYDFPSYGTYRTVGLIRNPLFNDVTITTPTSNGNFKRGALTVNNISGSFTNGEIIYQANTNTSATILVVNTNGSNASIYFDDIRGQFKANTANDSILGLQSKATANVRISNLFTFSKNPGTQVIVQQNTGAKGILVTTATDSINITNAAGMFSTGKIIYDASTNTYSNSASFSLAGNTKPTTFNRFNQLARITLSSNTIPFANNEQIEFKAFITNIKLGDAAIYSTVDDRDLLITGNTIPFSLNEKITQTTSGATAIMRYANSTHMKLTGVSGSFSNQIGYTITGENSSATATVKRVLPVLILSDFDGTWAESNNNYLYGLTSTANGYIAYSNTIIKPELVRESGDVLYIENREYITRSANTSETVRLLIKF